MYRKCATFHLSEHDAADYAQLVQRNNAVIVQQSNKFTIHSIFYLAHTNLKVIVNYFFKSV